MRDLYDILGVERGATADDIKKAYRRTAHRYHPDKNPGDRQAEERFKEVTAAYEILSDPDKRRRYDQFGTTGGAGPDFAGFREGFSQNVGDIFSEIFGDFFGGKKRSTRERGKDRLHNLSIGFREAVFGGERKLTLPRQKKCDACSGTGARPGTSPQLCHACGGSGEIRVQQGLFSVSKRCAYCKGRGKIITHPCKSCDGQGHSEVRAELKVRIPRGAESGTILRYHGEGEPGVGGGPSGDLRIVLAVAPHPIFRREGADIHCELPVSAADAILGAQIEVPTLDGRVRMKVPPGTQSGSVFRLRAKGAPNVDGRGHGDQHVKVIVETPTLEEKERDALATLRELEGARQYPLRAAFWEKVRESEA